MTVPEVLKKHTGEFENTLAYYQNDIGSIRTGRATPALVEDIKVNAYGQEMKIKELASITVPEPRTIAIQPWDRGVIEALNGAIMKSDIGITPAVDGQVIRLTIPQLTEERRKELTKVLNKKTEEARIKVRRIREDAWNEIQKLEKDGAIRENDKFKGKEDLQKIVDDFNKKIEELEKKKEAELMTV